MKISVVIFVIIFFFISAPQLSYSQQEKGTHNFKIIGKDKLSNVKGFNGEIAVEYDQNSHDHLFISIFKNNHKIGTKTEFRYSDETFELLKASDYLVEKKLIVDGIHTIYNEKGSVENELLFKDELLQQETRFYADGKKQSLSSGDGKILNGEFKAWYPNGQLSYSGAYKNNLKDGEFQLLDKSGIIISKGVYQDGKLISGEAVIQDIVYVNPEKPAQYIGGDKALDDYLKMESSDIKGVKKKSSDFVRIVNLGLNIDKDGSIKKLEILSEESPTDQEIIKSVFKKLPGFSPALVENVPVNSQLYLSLVLTNKGLQTKSQLAVNPIIQSGDSFNNPVYSLVEVMPEFPGGEKALLGYLIRTVKYPVEAMENGFQGKVFVSYIVENDGSISHINVQRGVQPSLDAEAIRVVKGMPRWIPGRQNGKTVRVSYTVPINFVLEYSR